MNSTVHWQEILPRIRSTFRSEFTYPHKKMIQWFPGHMNRGLKQMECKLKTVDCVLEVHDARIPISGRNPRLAQSFLVPKPYILILNKSDLIPEDTRKNIKSALKNQENIDHVIFTNAKNQACSGLKSIVSKSVQLITQSDRYNRADAKDYNVMVIGVPNVGKSSLINALRSLHMKKRHSLIVAPEAGLTKSVHERMRVCNSPAVYLFDTPGIMNPNIKSMETGMRLACCANFKDHLVGEEIVADYLLYWLNKEEEFGYVSALGLPAPTDVINDLLMHICIKKNLSHRIRHVDGSYKEFPDFRSAANMFIQSFRQLQFGPILLDKDLLSENPVKN